MPALRLVPFLALVALALVALSAAPLAHALVADRAHVARHIHARDAIARRKRSDSDSPSCKPRPSQGSYSPPPNSPTPTPTPTPTPIPSSASSSAPAPSPSTGGNAKGKWGLAWGADPQYFPNFDRPNVRFAYNWDSTKPDNLPSDIVYMAMLWGNDQQRIDRFTATVTAGYTSIVLGQNEPNEPSQSNLTPQEALDVWMQHINPLGAQGYLRGSPACTDDQAGLDWYKEFFGNCSATPNCEVDFIAFHAYTTSSQHVKDYATELHNTYGLRVAITEFADQDYSGANNQASMSEVYQYASDVKAFVESTDWIMTACPFGVVSDLQGVNQDNALLNPDGSPTSLAYTYFG